MISPAVGRVYLVGAGPGDPELLTRKAAFLLEHADLILHDDLVTRSILALASPRTLVVNVGKRCGKKRVTQSAINLLMINCARKGLSVVRLKSGDPLIFGRAGEEIEALTAAEIKFEIVPGITAGLAAAAAAGISLSDRRTASRVVFATGHLAEDDYDLEYWNGIARRDTTLVIYMPGPGYRRLAAQLIKAGLTRDTPCLVISRASLPGQFEQRIGLAALSGIAVHPPALLIIGEVARFDRSDAELHRSLTMQADYPKEFPAENW
jgi:uroporphyrin-III C-methyltransferase